MVSTFQELIVYQRAYAIALVIHKRSLEFPRIEQYALADQMRRASKSVCANIAEGFARHHGSAAEKCFSLYLKTGKPLNTHNYTLETGITCSRLPS